MVDFCVSYSLEKMCGLGNRPGWASEDTDVVVEAADESSENWSKSFLRMELLRGVGSFFGEPMSEQFSSNSIKNCFSSGILLNSKLTGKLSIVWHTLKLLLELRTLN